MSCGPRVPPQLLGCGWSLLTRPIKPGSPDDGILETIAAIIRRLGSAAPHALSVTRASWQTQLELRLIIRSPICLTPMPCASFPRSVAQ